MLGNTLLAVSTLLGMFTSAFRCVKCRSLCFLIENGDFLFVTGVSFLYLLAVEDGSSSQKMFTFSLFKLCSPLFLRYIICVIRNSFATCIVLQNSMLTFCFNVLQYFY